MLALAAQALRTWNQSTVTGAAAVVDGDSLRVGGTVIRLKGIDAPELQQTCEREGRSYRCGDEARRALANLVEGDGLTCTLEGKDRYDRNLARCSTSARNDIGAVMVEEGHAVAYGGGYRREETAARARRRGLWAGSFERPQDWRREHQRSAR
jgi:endonuclease YncB( thermonuclease family)